MKKELTALGLLIVVGGFTTLLGPYFFTPTENELAGVFKNDGLTASAESSLFDIFLKSKRRSVRCNKRTEVLMGGWCVHANREGVPQPIISGFENVYHPTIWYRNGEWHMLVGGWKDGPSQGWHDRIYRLKTEDPKALKGWELVPGPEGDYYIGNNHEDENSTDFPVDAEFDWDGKPIMPYQSIHTVQPDVIPFENYPGDYSTCCDVITYSYDYGAYFPEKFIGIHYSFVDGAGIIHKAGEFGAKNPLLDWNSYDGLDDPVVSAISDARVTYDLKTNKFYMVYAEWWDTHRGPATDAATLSLAVSNWNNLRFSVLKRNLIETTVHAANPQLIVGPDGRYYLFFTRFKDGLKVVIADDITGPYSDWIDVLSPGKYFPIVGSPYVFCNEEINSWQMLFYSSPDEFQNKNQIHSARLPGKTCDDPPVG